MKMNCWLVLGVLVAVSATAQNNTSTPPASLPPIPAPAIPAPEAAPEATPAATNAPVKKATVHRHKHRAAASKAAPKKSAFTEPTVTLVPGPAQVAVSNLNIRGQAGLKGEFIAHVNKGDTVTVISQINLDKHRADEPAQWAKIALPASVDVWVDGKFIDATNKTVLPKKLNLRAGPSENYSVLGVIERGTPVTETGEKDGWLKIQAPTNAYAFVAAMYLTQEASGTAVANPTPSPETQIMPETNAVPPTPTAVPEEQPIVSQASTNEPEMAETNAAPEMNTNAVASTESGAAPETNAPALTDTNAAEVDTNLPPPPPRVVTHEGFVRHVTSLIEPTAYELYDPKTDTDIDYLYTTSTNLNLGRYSGLHIIVTGEEGLVARWPHTPVLTIQKIIVVQ